jgi:hypothetical protein
MSPAYLPELVLEPLYNGAGRPRVGQLHARRVNSALGLGRRLRAHLGEKEPHEHVPVFD